MSKTENPDKTSKIVPLVVEGVHAPFIYFDEAPNFGHGNGVINVTLATYRNTATSDGGVAQDIVAVAHLRCTIPAAIVLRRALDQALLGVAPGPEQVN